MYSVPGYSVFYPIHAICIEHLALVWVHIHICTCISCCVHVYCVDLVINFMCMLDWYIAVTDMCGTDWQMSGVSALSLRSCANRKPLSCSAIDCKNTPSVWRIHDMHTHMPIHITYSLLCRWWNPPTHSNRDMCLTVTLMQWVEYLAMQVVHIHLFTCEIFMLCIHVCSGHVHNMHH